MNAVHPTTPDRKTKCVCPDAPRPQFHYYRMYISGNRREEAIRLIFGMCEQNRAFRRFVVDSDNEFTINVKWNMRQVSEWMDEINDILAGLNLGVFINWVPPFNPFTTITIPSITDEMNFLKI